MIRNLKTCFKEIRIYSRIVTNGFWAKTREHTDRVVSELMSNGLSQLRLSYSRWHQQHIHRENIIHAALSCQKHGLDYFLEVPLGLTQK